MVAEGGEEKKKKSRSGIVGAEPTRRVQQFQKFLSNAEVAPEGGPTAGNSAPNSDCCSSKTVNTARERARAS